MATDRDFTSEITDAVQAKDVARLAGIAFYLLGKVEHDDQRRARQAEKKRNQRDKRGRPGTSETQKSLDLSQDVPGQRGTSPSVSDSVQEDRTTDNKTRTLSLREIAQMDGDAKLLGSVDTAITAYGDEWPDVEAFLLRRDFAKWQGWLDEMARNVKIGSQFTPAHLGRLCRDDVLLEKPLGSAFALRTFLGNARTEMLKETSDQRSPATAGSARRRDTAAAASTPTPTSTPDQKIDFDR